MAVFDLELELTGVEAVWAVLARQVEGLKWAWRKGGSGQAYGHGSWCSLIRKNKKKKKKAGFGGGFGDSWLYCDWKRRSGFFQRHD